MGELFRAPPALATSMSPKTSRVASSTGRTFHLRRAGDHCARPGQAPQAGLGWQKSLFQWRWIEIEKGEFNWVESDRVVQASNDARNQNRGSSGRAAELGARRRAVEGPPDRNEDYREFVFALADRYKTGSPHGTIAAIQFWNEPNLTREWGADRSRRPECRVRSPPVPGQRRGQGASPTTLPISGPLSPTGTQRPRRWTMWSICSGCTTRGRRVLRRSRRSWSRLQGAAVGEPEELATTPEWGFHPSFGFRRIEQLRDVMVANGDAGKQIWLTEFGWTTDPNNPIYAWHRVSEEEKARYIVEAFHWATLHWQPWIGVMFVWNVASPGWTPADEEYWWSITNPDGTDRPAFEALQAARATGYLP